MFVNILGGWRRTAGDSQRNTNRGKRPSTDMELETEVVGAGRRMSGLTVPLGTKTGALTFWRGWVFECWDWKGDAARDLGGTRIKH